MKGKLNGHIEYVAVIFMADYELTNNTYIATPKDDPKDRITVEVGDSKVTDEFLPQVKIARWDNEVNFSARLVTDETATVSTQADKIIWSGDKTEAHFYDIAPNEEHPEGGYEFEVILKEKPLTNKIEFTLETKGLDFFYQPELTQEEKDEGAFRPANVIGSYAVYASENKVNYEGGKEYKCGKVGHIFRPKIIDSVGTEIWGELLIKDAILSVTIPQDFLDKAVYPISIDPNFGNENAGTSSSSISGLNLKGLYKATGVGESGTVTSITFCAAKALNNTPVKGVLVLGSAKTILTNGVTTTQATVNGTKAWWTSSYSTGPTIDASTNYCLMLITPEYSITIYEDFTYLADNSRVDSSNNYTTPTNPTDWGIEDNRTSIYCTYTAGGDGATVINPLYLRSLK